MTDSIPPDPPKSPPRMVWRVIPLSGTPQSDNPFNLDEAALQRMLEYLEAFLSQPDDLIFNQGAAQDELAVLEYMDAQVQGDDQPQALKWIMQAYENHKE
jgi:hypothetical protein